MGQVSTGECSVHRDHIVNDRILIDPDHSVVDSNHDRHVPGPELSVGISPPVRYVDIGFASGGGTATEVVVVLIEVMLP